MKNLRNATAALPITTVQKRLFVFHAVIKDKKAAGRYTLDANGINTAGDWLLSSNNSENSSAERIAGAMSANQRSTRGDNLRSESSQMGRTRGITVTKVIPATRKKASLPNALHLPHTGSCRRTRQRTRKNSPCAKP